MWGIHRAFSAQPFDPLNASNSEYDFGPGEALRYGRIVSYVSAAGLSPRRREIAVVEIASAKHPEASDFNKLQNRDPSGSKQTPCELHISIAFNKSFNLVRDQGVGGSNPLSPTIIFNNLQSFHLTGKFHCRRFCGGESLKNSEEGYLDRQTRRSPLPRGEAAYVLPQHRKSSGPLSILLSSSNCSKKTN